MGVFTLWIEPVWTVVGSIVFTRLSGAEDETYLLTKGLYSDRARREKHRQEGGQTKD